MMIYLDHAATAKLSDSMKQYVASLLDLWGNPSSLHAVGEPAKQMIADTRQIAAKFINADPEDIYFTSGGAASNTFAIRGYYTRHDCTILYSPIAHKSILKCIEPYAKSYPLKVDRNGRIDLDNLKEYLDTHYTNPFVIIDYANSEIGTVQNVKEIVKITHRQHGIVYLDCTGAIPQLPIDAKSTDADLIGFSGHKLGGLKGCGVLYKKKNIDLEPLIYGSQEQGLVGGTENVLGIASLGKAIEDYNYSSISSHNRDYVYDYICKNIPHSYLVGPSMKSGRRLPNNLYMCFRGIEGESLMMLLDMNGIQVSTGSACNSQSMTSSAALSAIGMNEHDIHSCIRFSFSGEETKEELDYVCDKLKKCVESLRRLHAE